MNHIKLSERMGDTFKCAICRPPRIRECANMWPLTLAAKAPGRRPYTKRLTPIRQLAPPWRVSHVHTRTKLTWHTRTLVDLDPLATRQQNVRWLNEAMAATLASHLILQ